MCWENVVVVKLQLLVWQSYQFGPWDTPLQLGDKLQPLRFSEACVPQFKAGGCRANWWMGGSVTHMGGRGFVPFAYNPRWDPPECWILGTPYQKVRTEGPSWMRGETSSRNYKQSSCFQLLHQDCPLCICSSSISWLQSAVLSLYTSPSFSDCLNKALINDAASMSLHPFVH